MKPAKRKKIERGIANTFVMLCALAGVLLADPYTAWRDGGDPVFIAPHNLLALGFSVISALGFVAGVQEFGGDPAGKHQPKRILKRCLTAFMSGVGSRVLVG